MIGEDAMRDKILKLLGDFLLEVEKYEIKEKGMSELDKNRILKDVEEHGITSSSFCFERLFVYNNGKIIEKNAKRYKLRKKDYGVDNIIEEEGVAINEYLNDREEAVVIASSIINTKPKGPHIFKKELEIYMNR